MRAALTLAALGAVLSGALGASAQEPDPTPRPPISGYDYMARATQELQDDDFVNPGFFAIDRGRRLWSEPAGASGAACADCHGAEGEGLVGAAARLPAVDPQTGALMNLEGHINDCRGSRMNAEPYAYESEDLLALTAYVSHLSRGVPVAVAVDGPAAPFFEQGRALFFERRGQLDLSCTQCHDARAGQMLRGDRISQGHVNGFPIYRLKWFAMGSRHRMFEWCNTSLRAEPFAPGSPEYLALELYVAWRGNGLPIETPAVRR
ncbi:MAG: sulfur oxidation protein SoxA [Pseudomonadota bacterium]|jgi:sulfur-oxidizing protein SoxA